MFPKIRFGLITLACAGMTACGDYSMESAELRARVPDASSLVLPGCGNNSLDGSEECDGTADAACPGRCSTQCACPATAAQSDLEVHAIDVGQGDSLLVWSPDGFVMLVDASNEGEETKIASYLASLGIFDIDYTLVTHMHTDHMGAMDRVMQQYPGVVWAFDSGRTATSAEYSEYDTEAGARRVTLIPGDSIDMGSAVQVDVVHGDISSSNENINSVVIRITHGAVTTLIGGDCESTCEDDYDPGQIDIYKVHHHGSDDSTSDLLLSRMQASEALISCGAGNPYGHPQPNALARLASYGVNVWRTDLDGDIVVRSDGTDYAVNGPLNCPDGTTRSCGTTDVGECAFGTQTCSGGTWGTCTGEIGPVSEDCGNGLDDDCDGLTDAGDSDCSGQGAGHLLISQVGYDTPGTDSIEEYIDIYNGTSSPVSLDGWSVQDNATTWTFPEGYTIQPGRFMSIARDAAGFSAWFGFDPDIAGLGTALGNSGDRLVLTDAGGATVDHVAWESYDTGWPITASTGEAIERADVSVDTDTVDDWVVITAAPRGVECLSDADCGAGMPRCDPASNSCVECLVAADCDDGSFCNGAESCSAGACQSGDAVDCSGVTDDCNSGTCDEAGNRCEATPLADGTACDDGDACGGDQCLAGACDPAPCGGPDHVLIAQVHYDTPGRDSAREFVELYNPTPGAVSLDGWALRDNATTWTFPAGVTIQPGAYSSVARDAYRFARYYGVAADVSGMGLSLGNSGDRVELLDASRTVVDHCAWEGVDGWAISAPTGTSIERLDLGVDTDGEPDWGLTTPAMPRSGG